MWTKQPKIFLPTLMLESDSSATEFLRFNPDSRFNLVAMSLSNALPQTRSEEAAVWTACLKDFTTVEFQSLAPVAWLSKANFES